MGSDQSCVPDISPQIDIDTLSGSQLREKVIAAVRTLVAWTKGPEPEVRLKMKHTFKLPDGMQPGQGDIYQKLSPGGRLLFFADKSDLVAIDLHNAANRVWSLNLDDDGGVRGCALMRAWSLHMTKSGTIVIALWKDILGSPWKK